MGAYPIRGLVLQRLQAIARKLGIELDVAQSQRFELYTRELLEWNKRVNLTAITDPEQIVVRHYIDSLSVALALPGGIAFQGSIVDVGSGGGFPGLPLALALPRTQMTLIESIGKKARFLEHVVETLQIEKRVELHSERAEVLAHRPHLRENFDVAVVRAVGKIATICELCLPFCRLGGRVIAQKKDDCWPEVEKAEKAIELLGGAVVEVKTPLVQELPGIALVVIQKNSPTPNQFPRRNGVPAKRPL